jgi:hypothetical protein
VVAYFTEIKKLAQERGSSQLDLDDIRNRLRVTGGFDESVLTRAIQAYEDTNVWARVGNTLVMI